LGISKDVVVLLEYLLPGFIAAWVFYGLTSHLKTSPFERTVQALIFTVIIKALTCCVGWLSVTIYDTTGLSIGTWDTNVQLILSVTIAIVGGHAISWAANTNAYHKRLYKWKVTSKTSLVSEWHSAFALRDAYVILHLDSDLDQRKILGWPNEWPDDPTNGHFVISEPEWLIEHESGYERVAATADEMLLISAKHVLMVEFLKSSNAETGNVG